MLRGFAPALAPLVVGFLLLLALISWLSVRNVSQMDEVAVEARELTRQHSARLELLLDLRLAVTRLDNEARTRHNEESMRVAPPFDTRLNNARDEVKEVISQLDQPLVADVAAWNEMRGDL